MADNQLIVSKGFVQENTPEVAQGIMFNVLVWFAFAKNNWVLAITSSNPNAVLVQFEEKKEDMYNGKVFFFCFLFILPKLNCTDKPPKSCRECGEDFSTLGYYHPQCDSCKRPVVFCKTINATCPPPMSDSCECSVAKLSKDSGFH